MYLTEKKYFHSTQLETSMYTVVLSMNDYIVDTHYSCYCNLDLIFRKKKKNSTKYSILLDCTGALDKTEYLVIIRDNFCHFCTNTYVVTPHLMRQFR